MKEQPHICPYALLLPPISTCCVELPLKKCFIYLISWKRCSVILRAFSVPKPLVYALSPFTLLRRPCKNCHFKSQGCPKSLAKNTQMSHVCALFCINPFLPTLFPASVPSTLVLSDFCNDEFSHWLFYPPAFMHYFHFCNVFFSFPLNAREGLKKSE